MYCTHCGKSIPEDSVFCPLCGQSLEIENIPEEHPYEETIKQNEEANEILDNGNTPDYLDIEIPGIVSSQNVRFTNESVSYKNKRLKYSDITAISCKQELHTVNLIPSEQYFHFSFYGTNQKIKLDFSTVFNIGVTKRKESFYKLFTISKTVIVPILVDKLVNKIIKENETIKIGWVSFNKYGYFRKMFFGREDWVHWEDSVAEPTLDSGSYDLYKQGSGGVFLNFSRIPLEVLNSILIPELIQSLYSILHSK
jgi:hypothetical protein